MLKISVKGEEFFDDTSGKFETHGDVELEFEHSLVALSKWESIWEKPFLSKDDKSDEEIFSYIECMCLTPNFPPEVLLKLTQENLTELTTYINAKQTATWFNDRDNKSRSRETITSELIYYWLVAFQIPFEVETWHLSRLFTLVQVCNAKQEKPKKMSRNELATRNRTLNEQRKAKMNTRG